MSEKQFYIFEDNIRGNFGEVDKPLNNTEIVNLLNEQQDQISYWKHKVSSLLWILGQFDKAKVKELLKELNNECELDDE